MNKPDISPPTGVPAIEPLPTRYVSQAPFDPSETETLTPEQEEHYFASQWTLMSRKFSKHKLAVVSAWFLIIVYAALPFVEFLAPYELQSRDVEHIFAPPQQIHWFHDGRFKGPFVYAYDYRLDMDTLKRIYTPNTSKPQPLRFFCQGDSYRMWGVLQSELHLVCPARGGTFFWLGTDRLGRDVFSRMIYGARISLTIGLIGVAISLVLAVVIGGIAGYFGGWIDNVIQRVIEVIQSFPQIPLWMALAAVLPVTWSPLLIYFGITIILALLDWTGLSRAVRSKLLALREEDYCTSAELMGAPPRRIIFRHLMPGVGSHLIAAASLTVPNMILGETALSFLGLGLRPPITSWGVLLNEAQNIHVVALYPWLLLPVVPVILVILAFNFLGDGLRDAADPYK